MDDGAALVLTSENDRIAENIRKRLHRLKMMDQRARNRMSAWGRRDRDEGKYDDEEYEEKKEGKREKIREMVEKEVHEALRKMKKHHRKQK